jgi:hypothetical protein
MRPGPRRSCLTGDNASHHGRSDSLHHVRPGTLDHMMGRSPSRIAHTVIILGRTRCTALSKTAPRRLLKSCAIPPVSCPIASIFWLCRSASSAYRCTVRSPCRLRRRGGGFHWHFQMRLTPSQDEPADVCRPIRLGAPSPWLLSCVPRSKRHCLRQSPLRHGDSIVYHRSRYYPRLESSCHSPGFQSATDLCLALSAKT